ncbi:hypothetical protein BHE74_00009762 [Ensete ventricosum]|nr:hypothetical protein BHE74_00009762 [Ensete ventricosum]
MLYCYMSATENVFKDVLTSLPKAGGGEYGKYYSLPALNDPRIGNLSAKSASFSSVGLCCRILSMLSNKRPFFWILDRLPYSIRILLESAIRNCDNFQVTKNDVEKIIDWENTSPRLVEIPFKPARVLLQVPVDLVIDHSVQVDVARSENAVQANMEFEFQRNKERFGFLKWGSTAFRNMLVVPPGSGIVHQVNLEYLGRVVFNTDGLLYPDSVVGTDSHTTMIDGLGVAGWGVGGIEAEATMLGQVIQLECPNNFFSDDSLTFHSASVYLVTWNSEGMGELSLADRATIANMSPEYGATMGFFPVDHQPQKERIYSSYLELDLADVEPCISGPKSLFHCDRLGLIHDRPHDRVPLREMKADWHSCLDSKVGFKVRTKARSAVVIKVRHIVLYQHISSVWYSTGRPNVPKESQEKIVKFDFHGQPAELKHGNLVIAAITSCTNTSNPNVMLGSGLVAKKACELGLQVKPWIKTSLAPGSGVVTKYLLKRYCILGWTTSLTILCFDSAESVDIDFEKEPIGTGKHGKSIYFKDIWPSTEEIAQVDTKTFSNYYM